MTKQIDPRSLDYLKECCFFSSLPENELLQLLPYFEKVQLHAGEQLFSQGEDPNFLYILTQGELIAYLNKPYGKTKVIGSISPVETVGELGTLSGEPRSLTVAALTESELLKLPSIIFRDLCEHYPVLLNEVTKCIVQRSIKTIKLITHEKTFYNVSLIFSDIKNIPLKVIKDKIMEHVKPHNVIFLSGELETDELIKRLKEAQVKDKAVIIFMENWKEDIYKFCLDKLSHLYLILNTEEKFTPTPALKEILMNAKRVSNLRTELILIQPDNIRQPVNTRKWLDFFDFNLHHHLRLQHPEDLDRLARFMTGNANVVVLGGGGAKGLTHLGVIKALQEKNIPIDAIGGTSIGAGLAVCYAYTQSYEKATSFAYRLKRAAEQSLSFRHMTWPIISLYSSDPVTSVLIDLVDHVCIEDLWIPFFAVSSNLTERKEVIHTRGMVWEAIRSSAAIPGIFPPVVYDGQLLFDGGLLNNLPVNVMREMVGPGHTVIASSLARKEKNKEYYHFPPILTRKHTILSRLGLGFKNHIYPPFFETFLDALLVGSFTNESKNALEADILVKPNLTGYKMLSLEKSAEEDLVERGYKEAIYAIEKFTLGNPNIKK